MDIINQTKYQLAFIAGRMTFPKHSLALIVKGTFDLSHDKVVTVSEEQLFPTGDEPYSDDDEGTGSSCCESDFAYFKTRTDLLLAGKCYPANGKPVPTSSVTFQVGNKSKTLNVFGNRYWQGLMNISEPIPFTEMDLRYENSFGGEGYKKNPVGKGFGKIETEFGTKVHYLPNIENPQQLIRLPGDRPEPAGLGPIGKMWHQRFSKMGTYKGAWLKERWPWFPKDFDWSYFNAAPRDMQVEGYLKGDEKLYFENLHPTYSKYNSQLPGIRIRLFVNELDKTKQNETVFKEVKLNLDTLWADMEAEKLVLVWRGFTEVSSEDYEEIQHVFIISENINEHLQSLEYYKELFYKSITEDEDDEIFKHEEPIEQSETIDVDEEIAKAEAEMRAAMIEAGIDPDEKPPPQTEEAKLEEAKLLKEMGFEDEPEEIPITREIVQERATKRESFADEDLSNLDLSGIDFGGVDFTNAILKSVNFEKANLTGANFTEANLEKTNFSGANFNKAKLTNADFTEANLMNTNLSEAELTDTIFEKANLANAILDKVKAADSNFTEVNLTNASLKRGQFKGAYFSKAILNNANFSGANLQDVSMEETQGFNVNMTAADLTQLRASDGCNFTKGIFRETIGRESIWEGAMLAEADFSYSKMEGADFTSANLEKANFGAADMKFSRFTKANLKYAKFISMNLFQGSLEKTNLFEADFRGSNLYEVEFLGAKIERTRFEQANLKMTKLAK
ncbi:MAG: DUF2169 domain-containing protein [Melioribacteraceae bacterium]